MWASGTKVSGGYSSKLKATFWAATTIPTGTWTKLPFKGVEYDNDSEVDIVTNDRWDVKADGIYRICAVVSMLSLATTLGIGVLCTIRKNGASIDRGHQGVRCSGADSLTSAVHNTCLVLEAGDYIEVFAYHNHGADRSNSSQANYMTAERIG